MPLTYAVKIGVEIRVQSQLRSDVANFNCKNVLKNTNLNPEDVWLYWLALVAIFAVLRLGGAVSLAEKGEEVVGQVA